MLAAAVSRPSQVTLQWLRLCGILSLVMAGVALFFYFTREVHPAELSPTLRRVQVGLLIATIVLILAQLAFVQVAFRATQRFIAGVADTEKELPYYARGATGWGVRMLVEWVSGRMTKSQTRMTNQ